MLSPLPWEWTLCCWGVVSTFGLRGDRNKQKGMDQGEVLDNRDISINFLYLSTPSMKISQYTFFIYLFVFTQ